MITDCTEARKLTGNGKIYKYYSSFEKIMEMRGVEEERIEKEKHDRKKI